MKPCSLCVIGALIQQLPAQELAQSVSEILSRDRNRVGISSPNLTFTQNRLQEAYGVTMDELLMLQAANDFAFDREQLARRVAQLLEAPKSYDEET